MKKTNNNYALLTIVLLLLATAGKINSAYGQCATTGTPSYTSGCSNEYFVSMSASGTTVVSTISLAGGTCGGTTYFNDYATQGVTVTAGNTVNINTTRFTTTYTAYLSVYVDWNNDGTFTPATELAGTVITMPAALRTTVYSFPVPTTGIVTGVNLHMRVFISEVAAGSPCTANYGQAYDYYLKAICPPTVISATPASGSICAGGTGILLTGAGAGAGGTYSWTPSAGLSATTGATVTATPAITTVYTVTGTTSIGCSSTATATVTLNPAPTAVVTAGGPLTICTGDSVVLSSPAIAGNTCQWYNGATAIPGATNNSYTALASGSYSLTATNAFGCTATSATFTVIVHAVVPVSVTAASGTTFCAGDSVKLTATSGAGYTYQWYNNGVIITGAVSAAYEALASGNYSCHITIPGACIATTTQITVTAHPVPVPLITFDGKVFRTGNNYRAYQWYENGIIKIGSTLDSLIARSNGNYSVVVTDSNGCKGTSTIFPLTRLAVHQVMNTGAVSIYPNPANSVINIDAPVSVSIIITNATGKKVAQQKEAKSLDISNLPAGMYVAELFDNAGQRLLIQKLIKN